MAMIEHETSPQPCPSCCALPDLPCYHANGKNYARFIHAARKREEYGGWLRKFDMVYRDRVPGWNLSPYSKRRAA